jgi:hypothetical protein
MWVVHFPRGFETLDVAVIGHGLCGADVIDAAMGFLNAEHPESLTAEERDAAFPDEHGIAVTPPSRSKKAWEPTPAQTAANDDEMRANGSFQEGRRKPVAERNGDIHRMSFARSEAVTEAAKSLRVQCGNGNTVDGWYDRLSRNWVVQVKDSEETQIGDAEYSGSRGSFENSMQCLIDQNGGRVCETTGTASVGAGSTARRHRSKPEDEDRDLPIDLIESIAEIPSTDADEPSGYMLDGNDLIALQQTASGEAADSEVQSWLEECGLIADGQVTPHGQRILDGNAAH